MRLVDSHLKMPFLSVQASLARISLARWVCVQLENRHIPLFSEQHLTSSDLFAYFDHSKVKWSPFQDHDRGLFYLPLCFLLLSSWGPQ